MQTHSHNAGCTKAVMHQHAGAHNHSHHYNCQRTFSNSIQRAPMAKRASGKPQASATNVQEKGVDEADFVKTDGRYLFAITNNNYGKRAGGLRIFDTLSGTKQPKQIATIGFHKGINLQGMYLMSQQNKLIIIGSSYGIKIRKSASRWSSLTHIITLDIRNKTKPKVLKHVQMEGYSNTTRRIGNQLYLVLLSDIFSFPSTYKYLETPSKMTKGRVESKPAIFR